MGQEEEVKADRTVRTKTQKIKRKKITLAVKCALTQVRTFLLPLFSPKNGLTPASISHIMRLKL